MSLKFAALATMLAFNAQAKLDAVRLDPVPIDTKLECDRVFFAAAQRNSDTIYVMPRVVIGKVQDVELFQIEPTGANSYTFSTGVYFPRDDERMKAKTRNTLVPSQACNFEEVLASIQKTRPNAKTIARMPLTSIEVSLPGLKHASASIGHAPGKEPDILNYYGSGYTLDFKLDEEEKNQILRRLARPQGLSFDVLFKFQARSYDGTVSIDVDFTQLATAIQVAAQGKSKFISKASLQTTIEAAMKETNVSITREEGSSDSFKKTADKIIEMILSQKQLLAPPERAKEAKTEKSKDLLSVDLVANFLATKSKQTIRFENLKTPESATAATTVTLESRLFDPNVREISVVSGEQDPTLDDPIAKDHTIQISAGYWYKSHLKFHERKSFLTLNQIHDLHVTQKIPMVDELQIANQDLNGRLVAVGRKNWLGPTGRVPLFTPTRTVWQRTERYPERIDSGTTRFSAKIEELKDWPAYVSFSALGRRLYHVTELLQENENWSAELNSSGAIVLKAKTDLGLLTMRESFEEGKDYEAQDVVLDEVTQIDRSVLGGETRSEPAVLRRESRVKTKTTTMVFYVSRPRK